MQLNARASNEASAFGRFGLDTCLYIMEGLLNNFPFEIELAAPEFLREKVAMGELGS
jgi:3-hydroxyacyl-CoA dehydrogenase